MLPTLTLYQLLMLTPIMLSCLLPLLLPMLTPYHATYAYPLSLIMRPILTPYHTTYVYPLSWYLCLGMGGSILPSFYLLVSFLLLSPTLPSPLHSLVHCTSLPSSFILQFYFVFVSRISFLLHFAHSFLLFMINRIV